MDASRLLVLLLSAALALPACNDDPDGIEACRANCDRSVAAGCANTPPDWASQCQQLCASTRDASPACEDEIDALSDCAYEEVNYRCSASGDLEATPQGACTFEGLECLQCTSELLSCSGF